MLSDEEKRREVRLSFPRSNEERDGLTQPFLTRSSTTSLLRGLHRSVQLLLDIHLPKAPASRLDPRTTLLGLLQAVRALSTLQRNIADETRSPPRTTARRTRSRTSTRRSTRTNDGGTDPSSATRARTTSQPTSSTRIADARPSPRHHLTTR